MAVGAGVLTGDLSYVALGREITYGTYVTGTANINFLSATMKAVKETKIIEEIQTSRTESNYIQLSKKVTGNLNVNFSPRNQACVWLLQNAFGGGPTTQSATATGDTTGAVSFTHTIDVANFLTTYSSLSMNMRKGDGTNGKIFEYSGIRVNQMTLKGEIDAPLTMDCALICKDVTLSGNDVSGKIIGTTTALQPVLSFVGGRFSVETGTALVTTTSYWNVESFEFKISNNLKADKSSMRIGSDVLQVLPAGLAKFELKAKIRFDTTTAFDAMMAGTRLVAEFEFLGDTLPGSKLQQGLKITMPYVFVGDAGDPAVSSPNEPLTSEVSFQVLRDPTTSGYACKAIITNDTANYT